MCGEPVGAGLPAKRAAQVYKKRATEVTLIDIKTGAQYNDHIVQASAYWNALNRKPKVAFIYLDGIIDRNPSQLANIHYFSEDELEAGYEIFLDKYVDFK